MFMRSDARRHLPLPEVWDPSAVTTTGTPGATTVTGDPAYPGSAIWTQPVWADTGGGLTGSPSAAAGGQNVVPQTQGGVDASVLFQMLGAVSPETMKSYQRKLVQANLLSASSLSKGSPDNPTMTAFSELFMIAIRANQGKAPKDRLTWYELLDDLAASGSPSAAKAAAKAEALAHQPTTTTSTQAYTTGEDDADAYLTAAMTELLGRAPNKKEVAAFTSRLNAKEEANPTVTTTQNDGYGNTTSSTEASNVSAAGVADSFAGGKQFSKESGAYKIQQYAAAFENLLGGA